VSFRVFVCVSPTKVNILHNIFCLILSFVKTFQINDYKVCYALIFGYYGMVLTWDADYRNHDVNKKSMGVVACHISQLDSVQWAMTVVCSRLGLYD